MTTTRTFWPTFSVILCLATACATAKPTPPRAPAAPTTRATHVDPADAWRLRAAQAELAEQVARRDAAKLAYEAAERLLGPANDELLSVWRLFETKYGLDPLRDRFDRSTLEIRWAPRTAENPANPAEKKPEAKSEKPAEVKK